MAGLLGDIFSAGNVARRKLTDLLGNPLLSAQQFVGNINDKARVLNEMTAAAAREGVDYGPASQQLAGLLAEAYNPIGMTVYHGSPAKFTKFDPTKIGSGEGAQAYGYGHYVAESPGVAKEYQDVLASPRNQAMSKKGVYIEPSPAGDDTWRLAKPSEIGKSRGQTGDATQGITDYRFNSPASAIKYAKRQGLLSADEKPILTEIASEGAYRPVRSAAEMEDRAYNQLIASEPGHFYEIDLPDEQIAKMIDWDKPLSQLPQKIQQAIYNDLTDVGYGKEIVNDLLNRKTGMELYKTLYKGMEQGEESAINLAKKLNLGEQGMMMEAPALASESLRRMGIPGIRYLDQGSRGLGEGTSNFVVFPGGEDLLTILKRNGGLLGP